MKDHEDILEVESSHPRSMRVYINAALGGLIFGYNIGVFNISMTSISEILEWGDNTRFYSALFSTFLPLGGMIGSLVFGELIPKYGLYDLIRVYDFMVILGSLLSIIPYTVFFGAGRLTLGITIGGFICTTPLYIKELSPPEIRGKVASLFQLEVTLGIILSYSLGLFVPISTSYHGIMSYWWIFLYSFQSLIGLTQYILLTYFYNYDVRPMLEINSQASQDQDLAINAEELLIETFIKTSYNHTPIKFMDLFCNRMHRKMMFLGSFIALLRQFCGINAVFLFSTILFKMMGNTEMTSRLMTLSMGVFQFIASFTAMHTVDKFGRKSMMVIGTFGMGLSLVSIVLSYRYELGIPAMLASLLIFNVAFQISLGTVFWVYITDIVIERAIGVVFFINWFGFITVVFTLPYMLHLLNIEYTYYIYAGINFVSGIILLIFMVETRGLTRQEIRRKLHPNPRVLPINSS
jgi:MFS family permease